MALFKISKGSKNNLPTTLTEGYCWYTFEDSMFYIDFKDANGVLTRKALNAKDAETLGLHTVDEFLLVDDIAQEVGDSETAVMSQKAVSDLLSQYITKDYLEQYVKQYVDEAILGGEW